MVLYRYQYYYIIQPWFILSLYVITATESPSPSSGPTVDPIDLLPPEERHQLRRQSIQEACKRFTRPLTLKEKISLYLMMIVDDKHRTIWCPVRKSATTTWQVMMMILYGRFPNISKAADFIRTHNGGNGFQFMTRLGVRYRKFKDIEYRLKNYTKFMVYREPMGRVISDYRQIRLHSSKFRSNVCKKVVKHQETITGSQNTDPNAYKNITYPHFVDYVTMFGNNTKLYPTLDVHWRPINLLCHPCEIDYDYYIDLERSTVTEDSNAVLKAIRAPDWLRITKENPSGNETRQTFFSQLTRKQFQQQRQMYKDDFEIFGYKPPEQTASAE